MIGFCTLEMANVAIGADRRCLTDQTFTIAPSTACAHRTWLGVDGWSACVQVKPCKPRPAALGDGPILPGEDGPPGIGRDRVDLHAREIRPAPKLTKARKPIRTIGPSSLKYFLCSGCSIPGLRRHTGTFCQRCYQTERRRAMGKPAAFRVPTLPCPICESPFLAKSYGDGTRRKTCSPPCRRQRIMQRRQQTVAS